jgi:predicted ATPase with chaperone activity
MNTKVRGTSIEELRQQLQRRISSTSIVLGDGVKRLLENAVAELGFDGHVRASIIRVARTIANLDGSEAIGLPHLCEAINYRPLSSCPEAHRLTC